MLDTDQALTDSHAHLISGDTDRYPPAPVSGELRPGTFDDPMTAERLLAQMDAHGVERALLVQRTHVYGFDNSYVCDAAAAYPQRMRPICAIDAREPGCGDMARAWHRRGAIGFRMMEPVRGQGTGWFGGDNAIGLWQAAADLDVPLCLHFFGWNRDEGIAALAGLLQRFPDVTVVVDHLSNGDVVDAALERLADHVNVILKFTTIPLGRLHAEGVDSGAVLARFVAAFGASRLMWGSDVAQSAGSYAEMIALARAAVSAFPAEDQRLMLRGTANSIYALEEIS